MYNSTGSERPVDSSNVCAGGYVFLQDQTTGAEAEAEAERQTQVLEGSVHDFRWM
jgi:hypothetical protein